LLKGATEYNRKKTLTYCNLRKIQQGKFKELAKEFKYNQPVAICSKATKERSGKMKPKKMNLRFLDEMVNIIGR